MPRRANYNPVSSTEAENLAESSPPSRPRGYNSVDTTAVGNSGGSAQEHEARELLPVKAKAKAKGGDENSEASEKDSEALADAVGDDDTDDDDDDSERFNVVILDSAQSKFTVPAKASWTVAKFKKVGATIHKVPPASQRLIYRGKMLADDATLDDCKITDDNVIVHLFPKPRVIVTSSAESSSSAAAGDDDQRSEEGGAHVPQIVLDEEEAQRRGQILVLGSNEIAEAQNNVKLLSLLLLVVCSMRLLALFSIAMGVANEPVNSSAPTYLADDEYNTTQSPSMAPVGFSSYPQDQEYESRDWETKDYFDLIVSGLGFYVATLGMKATTENTMQLATQYLIGTFASGVGFAVWNSYMYVMFVQNVETDVSEHNTTHPNDNEELTTGDFVMFAFFMVIIPAMVWILCCFRAWQFRQLLWEAEVEATERIQSQLGLREEDGDVGDAEDITPMV